jgi:hypothetical protein
MLLLWLWVCVHCGLHFCVLLAAVIVAKAVLQQSKLLLRASSGSMFCVVCCVLTMHICCCVLLAGVGPKYASRASETADARGAQFACDRSPSPSNDGLTTLTNRATSWQSCGKLLNASCSSIML